ncbi:hypothetical protein BD311DRAFT_534378, partial [Dichomitus squalens]
LRRRTANEGKHVRRQAPTQCDNPLQPLPPNPRPSESSSLCVKHESDGFFIIGGIDGGVVWIVCEVLQVRCDAVGMSGCCCGGGGGFTRCGWTEGRGLHDPVLDALRHVVDTAGSDVVWTAATVAMVIVRGIAPAETLLVNHSHPAGRPREASGTMMSVTGSVREVGRLRLDKDIGGCRGGEEDGLDLCQVWLRGSGEDVGTNRVVGRVEVHKKNVSDLCVRWVVPKVAEHGTSGEHSLNVAGHGLRGIVGDVIELTTSTDAVTHRGLFEMAAQRLP